MTVYVLTVYVYLQLELNSSTYIEELELGVH